MRRIGLPFVGGGGGGGGTVTSVSATRPLRVTGAVATPTIVEDYEVATIAALTAYPSASLVDGCELYVKTLDAPFYFLADRGSLAIDGITVVTTASGGTTAWVRKIGGNRKYETEANLYVDAGGSDEATGLVGFPLATMAELCRRVQGLSFAIDVVVHCSGDLSGTLFDPDITIGPDKHFRVLGTKTVTLTSTTTSAVTLNRATNTPYKIGDVGNLGGTLGDRFILTATGSAAWIAKEESVNLARTGRTWDAPTAPFPYYLNYGTDPAPGGGDGYTLSTLSRISTGTLSRVTSQTDKSDGNHGELEFYDCSIYDASGVLSADFNSSAQILAYGCSFNGSFQSRGVGIVYLLDCYVPAGINVSGRVLVVGGVVGGFITVGEFGESRASLAVEGDCLLQGIGLIWTGERGGIDFESVGRFDSTSRILVGTGGFVLASVEAYDSPALYGSNNTNGIHVVNNAASRCELTATPTMTNASGEDFRVGAGGAISVFDVATAIICGPFAQTYANLIVARPAGFGNAILNLDNACVLIR